MIARRTTFWVQEILKPYVEKARILVDGTAGNGWDTLYLVKYSSKEARIFSFDIQPDAIENTRNLIEKDNLEGLKKVNFVCENHKNFQEHIKNPIDVAMMNLGYLPNGKKFLTTHVEDSFETIIQLMFKLKLHGAMSITCYPGHPEGKIEYEVISDFLATISSQDFQIMRIEKWNHIAEPPIAFLIERIKEDNA